MPELPEVQTVVLTVRPGICGRTVAAARLLRDDILHPPGLRLDAELAGRSIVDVTRRGKQILIAVDSGATLCTHLGMTGRLTLEPPSAPLRPHTHLVIDFCASARPALQLRFRDPRRFGGLWWLAAGQPPPGDLGPDALTVTPGQLASALARTRRAIKTALLDQHLLAGLGNIYADEALFLARIHPQRPANRLRTVQVRRLCDAIHRVLRQAIDSGGSSFRDYVDANGKPGAFQSLHRVYAREGQKCARCGTVIRRIVLGGRSAHFCPRCQRTSASG